MGHLQVDDRRKEIQHSGTILELSPTEFELLKFMVINNGIVLSKATILEKVWGYDFLRGRRKISWKFILPFPHSAKFSLQCTMKNLLSFT